MVTIPKKLRERAKLEIGDIIVMSLTKKGISLKKGPKDKNKGISNMLGKIRAKKFDLKKTMKDIKLGGYDR